MKRRKSQNPRVRRKTSAAEEKAETRISRNVARRRNETSRTSHDLEATPLSLAGSGLTHPRSSVGELETTTPALARSGLGRPRYHFDDNALVL